MSTVQIRQATEADAPAMAALYNPYIRDTVISFEYEPVSVAAMQERIRSKLAQHTWIVAERAGVLLGYAYYGRFRERAAYGHVVESSVYLAPAAQGQGLGRRLYAALIDAARQQGYREMIGVITVPNPASIALHRQLGFVPAGHIARAGNKLGQFVDVEFWQLRL
jgi:L-amino acid N-acyltransferase YncA